MAKTKTKKVSRRAKVKKNLSVWEAMNEPIAYPTEEFGRHVAIVAVFIMAMAWLSPALGHANTTAYILQPTSSERYAIGYESMFGEYQDVQRPVMTANVFEVRAVLGANTEEAPSFGSSPLVGEERWGVSDLVRANAVEFSEAMSEILDISDPVIAVGEFLDPGVDAVWNSWLELMADPTY